MRLLEQTLGHGVSEKYKVITTQNVVDVFNAKGFEVTSMQQSKVRDKSKDGYQKHLIRLTHADFANVLKDARPEIVVVNSYDGSTSLSMFLGAYRFICANGLMVGTGFGGQSVRHIGDIQERTSDGINKLVASIPKMVHNIEMLQNKTPSSAAINEFLVKATDLVLPETGSLLDNVNINSYVRRIEDTPLDAYTIFNVVQERAIKQGMFFRHAKGGVSRTRPVKSITRTIDINRSLWDLANEILT
jgi:hypothetical protein